MRRGTLLVLAVLLLCSSPVLAQKFELTPFYGYRWGGTLKTDAGDFVVEASGNYGVMFDMAVKPGAYVEFMFSRQDGEVTLKHNDGSPDTNPFDLAIEYWHVGGLYEFIADGSFRPFVVIGLGATHLVPTDDRDANWHFSGNLGVGGKYFFSDRFGLRVEARIESTSLPSGNYFCDPGNACYNIHDEGMHQGSVNAGLIIRF
jgi:hypothetical protein